jgi:hypothetical protein
MNFSSPTKVLDTIRRSDEVERDRSLNRVKVNELFNAVPPLSDSEAKQMGLEINVNWGEAAVLGQHGRRQYATAFLKPSNFFKISIPLAPPEKRADWETFITNRINRPLKQSKKYYYVHKYKWASVLLHGIGPTLWYSDDNWCPDYIAISDLRIPTDTTTDFENLVWFAVRHAYTVGELVKKVWGKNAQPHWNKKAIAKLLNTIKDVNYDTTDTWITNPEHLAEIVKQNGGYFNSDAVPTIKLWHFYSYDDDDPKNCAWKLCVVPDTDSGTTVPADIDEFLYHSDKPTAKELGQVLHCQFGDLNNDSPFKYHSVRSLGFELMEPCFWTNLTRCRMLQHTWESFNIWFHSDDPVDRARAQKIELFNKAVIPKGVRVVPQTERHQIDPRLVSAVMGELRQLMSEAAVSYTQDIHEPGSEEETATKTMAKVQQVNALLGGLLDDAFQQETFSYREICRRFCLRKSTDKDVQKFQKECEREGIDMRYVNVEYWDIEPEVPLGGGNQTMGMLQSEKLWQIRPALSPTAQEEVLHEYIETITNDSRKAQRLAPLGQSRGVSNAQEYAANIFGTLMQGVPVPLKEGLNYIDQIDTLLGLMAGVVARVEATGGMTDMRELSGLQTVAGVISQLVQALAQDEAQQQRVKQYGDAIGQLMNQVKAFAQRLQEQQKNGHDPEAMAKVQASMMQAKVKAQTTEASGKQKRNQKTISFQQEQERKNFQTLAENKRKDAQAAAEIRRQNALAKAKSDNETETVEA